MRCLIDGRVFLDRQPGGVTKVARHLISAMIRTESVHEWTMGTTGVGVGAIDRMGDINIAPTHVSIPNKLVALATWTRVTSFDRLIPGTFDVLFLPNLEMVGRPRIPYVLLIHDLSFLIEPRWFIPKTRLWHVVARDKDLIRGANALLAVSERTKEDLVRLLKIPSEKIGVLPMGLTHTSPPLSPPEKRGRYFLVLGETDPRKNVACVKTAFEILKKEDGCGDVELVVIGRDYRPSDTELVALMQNASALLYPSWYEGFGLPLHEATRFGTSLIASTAGALPETAPKGTIFVPPFKPHLWLQAMRSTLAQPVQTTTDLSSDWSAAGRMVVDTLSRVCEEWIRRRSIPL